MVMGNQDLTITTTRGRKLHIPQTNVEDLAAFAAWLTKLRTQHDLKTQQPDPDAGMVAG